MQLQILNKFRTLMRRRRHPNGLRYLAGQFPEYEIGRGSYGNLLVKWPSSQFKLRMGNFCSVARGVEVFLGGEHRPDWATTFPFGTYFQDGRDWPGYPRSKGDVSIGNDVWICDGALILSGVTIGDGAVIGARAVVAQDVPPYAMVSGSPAKLMRMRFEAELVERLLQLKWWNWPDERIKNALPQILSSDVEAFLDNAEAGLL